MVGYGEKLVIFVYSDGRERMETVIGDVPIEELKDIAVGLYLKGLRNREGIEDVRVVEWGVGEFSAREYLERLESEARQFEGW